MKKSHQLLSEAGESLDYLRDEGRHLGLYVTELETLVEAYRPSATQAVMKCKVASLKKRSIFKNMFCQVSDPSFLLGKCSFLGKAARRERKGSQ
jgi:hypothetical protein